MAGVADWLPEYDVRSRHERFVAAEPERAFAALLAAPSDPVVRALLRVRGLRAAPSIDAFFTGHGFVELARSETELVVGASGTPWRPTGRLGPFLDDRAGTVRMAADLRAEPAPGGTLLSTETRVAAADDAARRAFARYWRLVGPFSGLIRKRWLRAAARELDP
ncbi:MAG: hypothetical protein QOK32_863 [Gaiellaceae bacterium]|nr:hypothetical protein [Gaiellaceae bacterium]